jgi:hypothetical protein
MSGRFTFGFRAGLSMNTLTTITVEAPRKTGEEVLDASFALAVYS